MCDQTHGQQHLTIIMVSPWTWHIVPMDVTVSQSSDFGRISAPKQPGPAEVPLAGNIEELPGSKAFQTHPFQLLGISGLEVAPDSQWNCSSGCSKTFHCSPFPSFSALGWHLGKESRNFPQLPEEPQQTPRAGSISTQRLR